MLTFLLLSICISFCHVKRDPPEALLGLLTNLFAPAIVIQDGSGYFKRSGIAASVLHILGLLTLLLMVLVYSVVQSPSYVWNDPGVRREAEASPTYFLYLKSCERNTEVSSLFANMS